MKAKVKDGQTMADIAIQEFGSWEAMIAIAQRMESASRTSQSQEQR